MIVNPISFDLQKCKLILNHLYVYAVRMISLSTLGTSNKASLRVRTDSTTHNAQILCEHKLVFA